MTVNIRKHRRYRIRRITPPPVVSARPNEISEGQRLYILLTFIAAAGFFAGAYSFGTGGEDFYAPPHTGIYESFIKNFCAVMVYVILCFFCGLSAGGQAAGYSLSILKGLGAGYLSAYAVKSGDIGCMLSYLPFEAISIVSVIMAARENIRMSRLISRRSFSDTGSTGKGDLKLYFAKFAVITITAAAAAAIGGIASVLSGNIIK